MPTITAFVAAFNAKASNCTGLLESYLAGENRIINCHRQTNRNGHKWSIWQNTWSTYFIRITSVFSYLCSKQKTNTLHLYSVAIGNVRAACAQSFAPWQQATTEIMRRNLSYYCLLGHGVILSVLFFTHIPFAANHTINPMPPERLQQ